MDPSGLSDGPVVITPAFEPEASAFHDEMQGQRSTVELRAHECKLLMYTSIIYDYKF